MALKVSFNNKSMYLKIKKILLYKTENTFFFSLLEFVVMVTLSKEETANSLKMKVPVSGRVCI